jgi:hypothetical protein
LRVRDINSHHEYVFPSAALNLVITSLVPVIPNR